MESVPRISDAEWRVMRVIWARERTTTNEVIEALAPTSDWKPKTIMTMLNRLVKKGALAFDKKGREHDHYALVPEAKCVRAESRSFLRRVYGGALKPMLANFLEEGNLSQAELDELKQLLDERRG